MSMPSQLPSTESFEKAIEREAARLAIPLADSPPWSSLAAHLRLLYLWNPRVNLTAIRDPTEGIRRHTLESLEAAPYLRDDEFLADLGSGNGYPALPCLSIRPRAHGILFESVGRKIDFLRAAIRESGLGTRVEARQERLVGPESLPQGVTTVTMRGFPAPATWCLQVFEVDSVQRVLAWLSSEDASEIAASASSAGLVPTSARLRAHPRGTLLVLDRG